MNQYALVSYIEEPLGSFLDKLRIRLAPDCRPHAHVTILPPRSLKATLEQAETAIREIASQFHAFEVQLGAVKMFEASKVIYIEVDCGSTQLREMHRKLNCGANHFDEPFEFHPHITLAQNLPLGRVEEVLHQAQQRWSDWKGKVNFPVEELSFVQNTDQNRWLDLMHVRLSPEPTQIVR